MKDKSAIENAPRLGMVTFHAPKNAKVSEGKRGIRSIMVCRGELPVLTSAGNLILEIGFWGRVTPTPDGSDYDVSASLPSYVSAESNDVADAVLGHCERQFQRWNGFDDAYDRGLAMLTGSRSVLRPKLAKLAKPDPTPVLVTKANGRLRPTGKQRAADVGTAPAPAGEPTPLPA